MEAVVALAVRYFDVNRVNSGPALAPILNRVAPPDVPFLHPELRARNEEAILADPMRILQTRLRGIVDARQVEISADFLEAFENRKRALTYLRQE